MRFEQPYYVPPHAIERFRERVADLPTKTIRVIIQAALQGCKRLVGYQTYDHQRCHVYRAQFKGVEYLIPVRIEKRKTNAWAVVPTVLLPGMRIYIGRGERHNADTNAVYPECGAKNSNGTRGNGEGC